MTKRPTSKQLGCCLTVNSLVVDIIMPLIIGFGVKANVHDLFVVLVDGENKPENKTYKGNLVCCFTPCQAAIYGQERTQNIVIFGEGLITQGKKPILGGI